jgi:methionyl-tRNA formyltransferase
MTRRCVAFLGQGVLAARCLPMLLARPELRLGLLVGDAALSALAAGSGALLLPAAERRDGDILEALRSLGIDTLVSVQYPFILPATVLEAVGSQAFNLHNARLPDYRGHNALSHEILNGERHHSATLHWMQPRVDTGDIAFEDSVAIAPDETAWSLYQKAVPLCGAVFGRFVAALAGDAAIPRVRGADAAAGRFYSRSIADLKRITDATDLDGIDRKARAFHFPPHEPAFLERDGRRLYVVPVWEAR